MLKRLLKKIKAVKIRKNLKNGMIPKNIKLILDAGLKIPQTTLHFVGISKDKTQENFNGYFWLKKVYIKGTSVIIEVNFINGIGYKPMYFTHISALDNINYWEIYIPKLDNRHPYNKTYTGKLKFYK